MYLQITSRCNMQCAHCCYNCTAIGEDMSLDIFRKALSLCEYYDSDPFIGGGEPTLHPLFEQMLLEAMSACQNGPIGIITNGSITRKALMIAKLTKAGVVSGELSQDEYHDPIDGEVIQAFSSITSKWGNALRDTTRGGQVQCLPHGRGVELLELPYHDKDSTEEDTRTESDCPCEDWLIYPNGDIRQCGCEDSPIIGHVATGINGPCIEGVCFRSSEYAQTLTEMDLD